MGASHDPTREFDARVVAKCHDGHAPAEFNDAAALRAYACAPPKFNAAPPECHRAAAHARGVGAQGVRGAVECGCGTQAPRGDDAGACGHVFPSHIPKTKRFRAARCAGAVEAARTIDRNVCHQVKAGDRSEEHIHSPRGQQCVTCAGASDALEGGRYPPSRAPSLCPVTVSLTPSASFNGICNRQCFLALIAKPGCAPMSWMAGNASCAACRSFTTRSTSSMYA